MDYKSVYITFIIPSIGRESLQQSIDSLIAQTDSDWNAIIIFDGVKKNIEINDDRIRYIEAPKSGNSSKRNSAGLVRNIGLDKVEDCDWIGFLDDDDTISNDYIKKLKEEDKMNHDIDLCIFRMSYDNGYILPSDCDRNIYRGKVGISYAVKKYIINDIKFKNNPYEDFIFLKEVQMKKYKIVISPYITYFVKSLPQINNEIYDNNKILKDIKINNRKLYPRIYL